MCLSRLDRTIANPTDATLVVYKVLIPSTDGIVTPFQNAPLQRRVWNRAQTTPISFVRGISGKRFTYPSGFHCWRSLKAARTSASFSSYRIIAKVEVRKVLAHGAEPMSGKYARVVVAQEMRILEVGLEKTPKRKKKAPG